MAQLKLDYTRGEVIAEKYEVVDLLDESPLGHSYRVKHLTSGKYVRLLMLDPKIAGKDQKDEIIAAVRTAREVKHRSLIKVGELSQYQGVAFVTMEDFEGQSLRDLAKDYKVQNKQFSIKEAAQITIQILEACSALHAKDHVFRAIRPEYVLVSLRHAGPRGANVVADVRMIGAGLWDLVPSGSLAEDEFTRGEAQYLAPELKGVDPQPSERSDVYSVGVLFYEMLTGSTPQGTFQLPRTRRPDLPQHVDNVCELALAPAAEDRYPSAKDFSTNVKLIFSGTQDGEDLVGRTAVQPLAVGLALLVVVAVAFVLFRGGPDQYELARVEDETLRKRVYDEHPKPSSAEVRAIQNRHPKNMLYIPEGPFVSGRLRQELDIESSEPVAEVKTVGAFMVDAFEYPNLKDAPPMLSVTYGDAERLCKEQGKRLCTADEFEKACKGPRNYVYSYGDTFDSDFCGRGITDIHPSGALADCRSGWGVYDIAGNLREWTSTSRGETRRLVKGGLPGGAERGTRCAFATDESVAFADDTISFRCCRDIDAPPPPPPPEEPPE